MNTPLKCCRSGFLAVVAAIFISLQVGYSLAQGLTVPPAALQPPTIRWETDLNAALTRAEKEQRPLFLHFAGSENRDVPTGQQMEREVFVQPHIAAQLNANFVMVKINAPENPALVQKYGVSAVPTDVILKPNGDVFHTRKGVITADVFAKYLQYLQGSLLPGRNQTSPSPVVSLPVPTAAASVSPAVPAANSPAAGVPGLSNPQQPAVPNHNSADPFALLAGVSPPPSIQSPPATPAALGTVPGSNNPLRINEVNPSLISPTPVVSPGIVPSASAVEPALAALMAQQPAPSKMTVEVPLALEGYCPVMLCKSEDWVSGNPAYSTLYQGYIFRFSSMEALLTFAQDPASCTPVAMGEDIVLMIDRNKRVNGDRKFGAFFKGRVFLFSSQETFAAFEARPDYYTEIALKYETARKEKAAMPVVY